VIPLYAGTSEGRREAYRLLVYQRLAAGCAWSSLRDLHAALDTDISSSRYDVRLRQHLQRTLDSALHQPPDDLAQVLS